MIIPSQSAMVAACALDTTSANAYLHPEFYSVTTDNKPSSWPQECEAELTRMALQIDKAFEVERAMTRSAVLDLVKEFEMLKGFSNFGPDTLLRFNEIAERAMRAVNAPPKTK